MRCRPLEAGFESSEGGPIELGFDAGDDRFGCHPEWAVPVLHDLLAEGATAAELAKTAARQCSSNDLSRGSAATCESARVRPSYEGPARPIDRPPDDLSPSEFYERYVSRGLPAVFRLNSTGAPRWREQLRELQAAQLACRERGCSEGVNKMIDWPPGELSAEMLTSVLPRAFVPHADVFDDSLRAFVGASAFTAFEGEEFGAPVHFDTICQGSLSMQYQGRKKWTLWSPWPITNTSGDLIDAHVRFETELQAAEALFFTPGWFHATKALEGDSLAVVHALSYPVYTAADSRPVQGLGLPFGFELCKWSAGSTKKLARAFQLAQ